MRELGYRRADRQIPECVLRQFRLFLVLVEFALNASPQLASTGGQGVRQLAEEQSEAVGNDHPSPFLFVDCMHGAASFGGIGKLALEAKCGSRHKVPEARLLLPKAASGLGFAGQDSY